MRRAVQQVQRAHARRVARVVIFFCFSIASLRPVLVHGLEAIYLIHVSYDCPRRLASVCEPEHERTWLIIDV